jgi:hypothetical protein
MWQVYYWHWQQLIIEEVYTHCVNEGENKQFEVTGINVNFVVCGSENTTSNEYK